MLDIKLIPILNDNYVFFIKDTQTGITGIVDPGEAQPVIEFLDTHGETLNFILNTHHHGDHIGGNKKLIEKYGCKVIGPQSETHRITSITDGVKEGDAVSIGSQKAIVMEVPGHTTGHIVYHFAEAQALFAGDTLFAMGCGRLFEGSPAQMWTSLQRLRALPDDTRVYCAHEYTQHNGNFGIGIVTDNPNIIQRIEDVKKARENNVSTVPTTIGLEKKTNLFFRADEQETASALNMTDANALDVFTELRTRRNNF